MARAVNRLSARAVEVLTRPGRHADGGGLYVSVDGGGRKRWVVLYELRGRQREMGVGPAGKGGVSLVEAREAAAQARRLLRQGIDPIEARRAELAARAAAERRTPLFREVAAELIATLEPSFRSAKTAPSWRVSLGLEAAAVERVRGDGAAHSEHVAALGRLAEMPVDKVGVEHVLAVLRPLWHSKPENAKRCRLRVERVMAAAVAGGHRADGRNPAAWRGGLQALLSAPERLSRGHHAAMAFPDLPGFMARLGEVPGVAARAVEMIVLSACRSGEVRGMQWNEVDLTSKVWTIPAERMKAGREHRVPLSDAAIVMLKRQAAVCAGDLVFEGGRAGRPLSDMAPAMALRRLGIDCTVHGFRSAFRDWCGDATSFPRELAEEALAHAVGNATERAYRRSDSLERRRKLMDAWASFVTAGEGPATVVPLRRKKGGAA